MNWIERIAMVVWICAWVYLFWAGWRLTGSHEDAKKEPYPNAVGDVRETGKGLVEK